jgi:hypothetical protein
MADHEYNRDFFHYLNAPARASARTIGPILLAELKVSSLIDFGAGHGAWAAEWIAAGVPDVVAVDGDYVNADQLVIPPTRFHAANLAEPVDLGRKFDLVQSLEVAEHLPESSAETFVQTLTRHGDIILFSAAVPYQGGEHHVNEQPPEYWRKLFAARGFLAFDWLRPRLSREGQVCAWYRYNSFLYANAAGESRLSASILDTRVGTNQILRVAGNFAWHSRRAIVRLLPASLIKPIAMIKARVEAMAHQRSAT